MSMALSARWFLLACGLAGAGACFVMRLPSELEQGVERSLSVERSEHEADESRAPKAAVRPAAEGRSELRIDTDHALSAESAAAAYPSWMWSGQVVEPTGEGASRALVGFVELAGDAGAIGNQRAMVNARDDGRFDLEVPAWARNTEVLCVARRHGRQPFGDVATTDESFLSRYHELRLGAGHDISGFVLEDGQPVVGAAVTVEVDPETPGLFGAGREAWWDGVRLDEKHGEVRTASDGSFRISGLGAHEHRLRVSLFRRRPLQLPGATFSVRAPDRRVYEVSGARLAVTIVSSGKPLAGVPVRASSSGHELSFSSQLAPVLLGVPASSPFTLTVTPPNGPIETAAVLSPPMGEELAVRISVKVVPRPSLVITPLAEPRNRIGELQLRLRAEDGSAGIRLLAKRDEASERFVVPRVPLDAGPYELLIEPEGTRHSTRYLRPQFALVQLPEKGEVHVELSLELWGCYELEIDTTHSGSWSASYRILDEGGRCVQSAERAFTTDDRRTIAIEMPGSDDLERMDEAAQALRRGMLAPGDYTVEVTSLGHLPKRAPLRIEPRRTTPVRLVLTPK